MSNKHTPGPWVIDDGRISIEDQAQQLTQNKGTDLEWCAIGITDEGGIAEIVALAHPINAPLIAAAPELLAALEYALEHVEANSDDDDALNVIEQARAAIQKATKP